MRGSAPYFEGVKKRLMATIRQKGAPSLFVTLSCAEYHWIHLAQKIYETKHKVKVLSLDSTVIKTITCFVKRKRKIRNRPTIIIDEFLLSRSRYLSFFKS